MYAEPRLRTMVVYGLLCVALVGVAGYIGTEKPIIPGTLAAGALVFGCAAFLAFWNWGAYQVNMRYRELREARTLTTRLQEMRPS